MKELSYRNAIVYEVAVLMNDASQTEYTAAVVNPMLSLALGELDDIMLEANVPTTNATSPIYHVNAGQSSLTNIPWDLIEIQELGERQAGSNDSFISLPRREFPDSLPPSSSLLFWCWKSEEIVFNLNGANTNMEVRMNYSRRPFYSKEEEDRSFFSSNAEMFLIYKTATLCARFIGENETRAELLDVYAEKAMERIIAISNKGRQQIMTRHRPFRAGYKMRGY